MTFAAARVAHGGVARRAFRIGTAMPVIEGVTSGNGFTSSIVVTPPAGSTGDLIFIHLTRRADSGGGGDGDPQFNQTAGETHAELWNIVHAGLGASGHGGFWRSRTGADTTYTFDMLVSDWTAWICYNISGVDPVTPIIDFATKCCVTGGFEWTVPAVFSDITNTLLLQVAGTGAGLSSSLGKTFSWDGEDHAQHEVGGNNGINHRAGHQFFTPGGGSGTRTWSINGNSETRHAAQLAIAPIEGVNSFLEFEGSSDHILFEDGSGALVLE